MNGNSQYAFYGSLMQGMENYLLYADDLRFLGKVELPGFRMYLLEEYPYAVRAVDSNSKIVAELYKVINPKTEESIHELELDEGYIFSEVIVGDNKFGIYLFESHINSCPEISGGDWRAFRNRQHF